MRPLREKNRDWKWNTSIENILDLHSFVPLESTLETTSPTSTIQTHFRHDIFRDEFFKKNRLTITLAMFVVIIAEPWPQSVWISAIFENGSPLLRGTVAHKGEVRHTHLENDGDYFLENVDHKNMLCTVETLQRERALKTAEYSAFSPCQSDTNQLKKILNLKIHLQQLNNNPTNNKSMY